jgi:hypothetical protein
MGHKKPIAFGLENRLPDFVVAFGNGRCQQVAEC